MPIGPKARHLNRDFAYSHGNGEPTRPLEPCGALVGAPPPDGLPAWPSGTTPRAARSMRVPAPGSRSTAPTATTPTARLETPGSTSWRSQRNPTAFGILKTPVAAGLGSGGRSFDIVPGQPDQSIMAYRIASTHPGVMMPELGKRLVHEEGVALIRQWIAAMPTASPAAKAASRGVVR